MISRCSSQQRKIMHSLQKAKAQGKETIFNPAPAVPIPDESLKHIDHLIVNETEAATLSGVSESELANSLEHVANLFISKGVSYVVITLGSKVSNPHYPYPVYRASLRSTNVLVSPS